MKKLIYVALGALMLVGCNKYSFDAADEVKSNQIRENVEKVFGTKFDANHDWCTTTSGQLVISSIPNGTDKVQALAYVTEEDGETSVLTLNEADVNGKSTITLSYDIPKENLGIYVALISNDNFTVKKVENGKASFTRGTATRAISTPYTLPTGELKLNGYISSYASDRGWIEGERLYDYNSQGYSQGACHRIL